MNSFGERYRVTVFGESHAPEVGVVIEGVPAGSAIDTAFIASEMERRAPGRDALSTARRESDIPIIESGVSGGVATGDPIRCVIKNEDTRSGDYVSAFRPGHADWTAYVKYGAGVSRAGGGRFSGRLTAPIVFAGAVAKTILAVHGIAIKGRLASAGGVAGTARQIEDAILAAKAAGDSVGGIVEVAASGAALAGIGEPFFDSVESTLAALYFSVPAVKGVEFGSGFAMADMRGSEANDPIRLDGGRIVSETNHNGGVLGGIANGMPVTARVAIKPTSSIAMEQRTVDPHDGDGDTGVIEETMISVKGRHDPCIAPRAVPVIEAMTAIGLLDLWMIHD
jgi:chorismate synthase